MIFIFIMTYDTEILMINTHLFIKMLFPVNIYIYISDVHSLVPSVILSFSKSSIRSSCFHLHHHLIVGFFFFSFVMLLSLLLRLLIHKKVKMSIYN
jgi:hypothetical protein